ncbi:MAG: sigma 54-interacting transcriptional regulator [Acidobacteria bacterium]|nr:sigma 54-interacting transcriptional regulator [Acidobacteriota bacterium]
MAGLYEQALLALERGHGAEAAAHLVRALKQPGLRREDQIQMRCALAEAWLLQDDLRQAADALGKPPEVRERLDPARLSDLWRLHGRIAVSSGETSRGIAFLTKALTQAERAHDSRAIGLAHYELGHCYRQVGDTAIVREHLTSSASALHAAGDRRHLAMVHSLSGVALAQEGRLDEAMAALRQAERLAEIHLIRGEHDAASRCLQKSRDAYGEYGAHTSRWYQWSLQVVEARLALRRGQEAQALPLATEVATSRDAPTGYALQAELIAVEALLASGRLADAQEHLDGVAARIQAGSMSSTWGEFLRLRGRLHAAGGRSTEAYHDFGQSVSVFDLLGERYQAGLSYLELGRLAAAAGARSRATRYLTDAVQIFEYLGAAPDLADARAALTDIPSAGTGDYVGVQMDGDAAIVRRIVDAAVMPALLAREGATALLEACDAQAAAIFVQNAAGVVRVVACAGCDADRARALAAAAVRVSAGGASPSLMVEPLGRDPEGARFAVVSSARTLSASVLQRGRTLCAVLRQGFDLCSARERPAEPAGGALERPLEPLLPGFVCASAAMQRVADQIQRMQGNDLTVLVTGESGTGKDLVARAIHAGSLRRSNMFLPYNCTSATRELADSQLFGHRRGSFTGAVADQPGVLRTAVGGTLFLDEVGDLPLDVQPKLLRFLEQGEVLPVGDTRPQRVDVRVVAATNADLEHRVADGKFREDLFYRLSVIRIHVPPLRERREEIPHLSTFFLREACDRLGRPGTRLNQDTLDLFDTFPWPGNVRQLRNEVQRAVAMVTPGGLITPDVLSPIFGATTSEASALRSHGRRTTLAAAIGKLEREMIEAALERAAGNISETARLLGLTRRGLYLKMERLGVGAASLDN